MADDNDLFDELNWYTGDFDVVSSESKKEKKPSRSHHTESWEKEKRVRNHGEASNYINPSSLIDVVQQQSRRPHPKSPKPEKKVVRRREPINAEIPARKTARFEKREIKLYEPVKLKKNVGKVKEIEASLNPLGKTISKTVNPLPKSEPVKMPEPLINFSKTPINTKLLKTLTDKLSLLEERDKLIRSSQEKPSNLKQAQAIKGTCPDMCPEKERIMRSLKKMVSVFECLPNSTEMDHNLAVKEYARSSADQEEPLPHELRPEPVLTMSMSYIITRVITTFEHCEDISAWYDFCWNRLRAIRKDIVQQQLCDLETVTIVEQCARFHIVCFDRFWGMDSSIFDEKINTENLMNCLKILLNLYGDLRKLGITCLNEPEFNAYMILIKMNSGDILWEFLNFPLYLQQTPEVIEAVKIHMFYNSNMYSQFFNYLVMTSYLNACLMQRCFTQLRVRALEAIVKAYCPPNKEGKVSLQHIMKSLKFDSKEDALEFCKSCNIWHTERVGFKISHSRFIRPETLLTVKTPSSLVCNKRVGFAQAVVGAYNDMPVYFEHTVHNSFLNDQQLQPDALDASDQEEKMLRDDVKRKLLIKNVKNLPAIDGQNNSTVASSTQILQRSLSSQSYRRQSSESDASSIRKMEKPLDLLFAGEPEDIEMEEEMSESEDYDMPDALSVKEENNHVVVDNYTDNVFVDVQEENLIESDNEAPLEIAYNYQQDSPLSGMGEAIEDIDGVDDVDAEDDLLDEDEGEEEAEEEIIESDNSSVHEVDEDSASPINEFPSVPDTNASRFTAIDIPASKIIEVSPTSTKPPERRLSVSSQREFKSSQITAKLRSKLNINLQRISAKKYGRIWREKVREIKKSYGFVPLVSHMDMKEYLNVWGRSISKHGNIWNQLNNTKKLCSSVDSLLLFNIFDTTIKRLGYPICETLVDNKLKLSRTFESNQNTPIYWKLVISAPWSKVSSYDLYEQVLSWSEQAFFSSEIARNTRIETMICKGIKLHCKVTVLDGCDKLDRGKNLSALVMLNVPGWESTNDSQNRVNRLCSIANHPIPVYVVNLAPSHTWLAAPSKQYVSHFTEITANPTTKFTNILKVLASNTYQMPVKSLHICDLMSELLDRFLDALQLDCYNSCEFLTAMSNPTNILYLYNGLIEKLKKEIINIYKSNIFGTANEIISTITLNSKYNNSSISSILGDYYDSLIMGKLHWPPTDATSLLLSLKNYCDKSGIPQVLSHVIRMINPPDDDDTEQHLSEFLNDLNWLRIMEVIIKAHFRTKFCDVIVTYSEKSVNDLIDSHWWMECSLISKYCKN